MSARGPDGQSGNPKGRPRKDRSALGRKPLYDESWNGFDFALVNTVLDPFTVRDNGELRQMESTAAVLKMLKQNVAKGSVRSVDLLLRLIEHGYRLKAERIEWDHAFWQDYIDTYPTREQAARERGTPLAEFLPHPEDVMILSGEEVRIRGHYDEASYQACLQLKTLRDALVLRSIYDMEMFDPARDGRLHLTIAEFTPFWLDRWLPQRWQFDALEHQKRILLLSLSSRDSLRLKLKQAYKALGLPLDLDNPTPPMPDQLYRVIGIDPKVAKKVIAQVSTARTKPQMAKVRVE